jgi:hypothetical protein
MKKTVMMLVLAGLAVNAFAQYGQKDSTGLPSKSSDTVSDYGITPYTPPQPPPVQPPAPTVQVQCFGMSFAVPKAGIAQTSIPGTCEICYFLNGVMTSSSLNGCSG